MKKHLLFLFAALLPLVASAEKVEIDGIWYNLVSKAKQAEVTFKGDSYDSYSNEYSGSITIPATVTYNGVKYSVTSIGDWAFRDCRSLTAITISEGVTSIGEAAFYLCSSLTTITIPEGVTSIGNWAFYNCTSLKSITIPEDSKLTSIGMYAFRGCSILVSITIPESVTSIGRDAFYGCESLKTVINYSDLPLRIGSDDYGYVARYAYRVINVDEVIDGYAFKTIEGVHYLTGYIGDKTELTLPADYKGENYQIGDEAFAYCSSLTAISIPESVTSIGYSVFRDCSSLKTITIPEGVMSIGDEAFEGCSNLKTVINYSDLLLVKGSSDYGYVAYYADRVINIDEVIDGYAFKTIEGVHYLTVYIGDKTELTLPADYKGENYQIGELAFEDCESLTAITIPESVTSIGDDAFSGCSSLTAITIPENSKLTSIGERAFYGCSSLTAINIPEGVTSIGIGVFSGCSSLTAITIPEGVTSIKSGVFSGCSSLTAITIPESVTSIGYWAFDGCSRLERVTINCVNVGNWFSGMSSIKEIVLGESVRSIEQGAFSGCSSLESLHIGPNVDSYGSEAFAGCTTIKELTVMGNVMPEIPSENLTSITLYSPIPLVTKEFAAMVYRNATLNIPEGSLTRYQNADVWKNFWYVNEFDPKKGKDIYLTINQADNGYVKQHLTEGTICTFTIVAAEGWTIHSVTFNGEEVTAQLTEEGIFTTPALSDDAVLNIAYEKIGDNAIEKASANRIKVQGHHGTLRITGATEGDTISIYTTDGMLVAQESAEESETEITLPTNQVYIVTVGDKVVKIGM